MTLDDEVRQIRDLISGAPLGPELLKDRANWSRLCDGLDLIGDGRTHLERLAGLNAARQALDLGPAPDIDDGTEIAALEAGVTTLRVEVEDRTARWFRGTEGLMSADLQASGYMVEKAAAATGAALRAHGGGTTAGWDRGMGVDGLIGALAKVREGLLLRGLDQDHHLYDIDQGLYILRRAEQLLDGLLSGDSQRDVDLLVSRALPGIIASVRRLAQDVDGMAEETPGWDPAS